MVEGSSIQAMVEGNSTTYTSRQMWALKQWWEVAALRQWWEAAALMQLLKPTPLRRLWKGSSTPRIDRQMRALRHSGNGGR